MKRKGFHSVAKRLDCGAFSAAFGHPLACGTKASSKPLRSMRGRAVRAFCVTALFLAALPLTDANAQGSDDLPRLRPPRGEIPPGFWEQHGWQVIAGACLALVIIGALAWFLFRPKPKMPIPPEVKARRELESLRGAPGDGAILSRISRILRRYVAEAFGLPPGEPTTTEFCQMISGQKNVGEELAATLARFLHDCDERKFAPAPAPAQTDFAGAALKLVEQAEHRRAELRCMAAASANDRPA